MNVLSRIGRMRDAGWSKELEGKQLEEELNEALSAARAWMEITPEKAKENPSDTLQVGEMALLTVKSTLPGKYLWNTVPTLKQYFSQLVFKIHFFPF